MDWERSQAHPKGGLWPGTQHVPVIPETTVQVRTDRIINSGNRSGDGSWVWWPMLAILALGKESQKDGHEPKNSLGYRVRS